MRTIFTSAIAALALSASLAGAASAAPNTDSGQALPNGQIFTQQAATQALSDKGGSQADTLALANVIVSRDSASSQILAELPDQN
ncbi:MAG: hypothetical protein ACK4NA_12250 [Alphaproteobacteria bacterium]